MLEKLFNYKNSKEMNHTTSFLEKEGTDFAVGIFYGYFLSWFGCGNEQCIKPIYRGKVSEKAREKYIQVD